MNIIITDDQLNKAKEILKESPDVVLTIDNEKEAWASKSDAIGFTFIGNRCYVGYNDKLFWSDSNINSKVTEEKQEEMELISSELKNRYCFHAGIEKYYNFLGESPNLPSDRSAMEFPGRLWFDSKIISFWSYPSKSLLGSLLNSLNNELDRLYGVSFDFSNYRIDMKDDDTSWDRDDISTLISISEYDRKVSSSFDQLDSIHLLPSGDKKNTPQIKGYVKNKIKMDADKFNGNVSKAEWNSAKTKYMGERKKISKPKLTEDINSEISFLEQYGFEVVDKKSNGVYTMFLLRNQDFYEISLTSNDSDFTTFDSQIKTPTKSNFSQIKHATYDLFNVVKDWFKKYGKIYVGSFNQKRTYKYETLFKKMGFSVSNVEYVKPEYGMPESWCFSIEGILNERKKIKVTLDQLNEVKKYMLKEETVYHASISPIDKITPYSNYNKNKSGYYPGMYFFNDEKVSELFYDRKKYYIYKTNIDGLKLYDLQDGDELKRLASKNGVDVNSGSGYKEAYWLKSIGYDGIKRGKSEIILFNPESLNIELLETPNISENISIPVTTGDTIMTGKFKNKKTVVKTIDKDKHGMPTINGKQATTFRVTSEKLKEAKDYIYAKYKGESYELSNEQWDAMPFGYLNGRVWVGYTPMLGDLYAEDGYVDDDGGNNYPNFHADMTLFYEFINKNNYKTNLPPTLNREYTYYGRVWLESGVVSFYKYPKGNGELKNIMNLLSREIKNVYGETFDFSDFLVEVSEGKLLPISKYIGGEDSSQEVIDTPHLLPANRKKDSEQFKTYLQGKYDYIGKKLGDTTQAEYNHYKRYGMGESISLDNIDAVSFKIKKEEDEVIISAIYKNVFVGKIVSELISQDYYSYEFDDLWSEDEFESIYPEYKIAKIQHLEINEEHRGVGIAKLLMDKMLTYLRENGFKQFYLNASPMGVTGLKLDNLVGFYKKFGFKILKNQGNNIIMGITNGKNNVNEQLNEVSSTSVSLSSFKIQKQLNEKFWENKKLKTKIRRRLLKIADDFLEFINVDSKYCDDVLFLGSLSNYNWSKYSDVDLHLLVNFKKINKDTELIRDYFDSKKKIWNLEHEDLKIYGFPVELYVQDVNEENASTSIYSLEKNKWVKEPNEDQPEILDKNKIRIKSADIMTKIDDLKSEFNKKKSVNDVELISKKVKALFDKIKRLRKSGLESSNGEFSVGNIVFKVLRRSGHMETLIDLKRETYDKINTIK